LNKAILTDLIEGRRPSQMMEDESIVYEIATQLYRDKGVSDTTLRTTWRRLRVNGLTSVGQRPSSPAFAHSGLSSTCGLSIS
jgi:hypothetical protein